MPETQTNLACTRAVSAGCVAEPTCWPLLCALDVSSRAAQTAVRCSVRTVMHRFESHSVLLLLHATCFRAVRVRNAVVAFVASHTRRRCRPPFVDDDFVPNHDGKVGN